MIEFKNVRYSYQNHEMALTFKIARRERVAILGSSGAGKSTLLNLIAGFILPDQGQIFLEGQNANGLTPSQRPVAMLFQENNLFTHLTVYQNLALGLNPSVRLTPVQQDALKRLAEKVGVADLLRRYPYQLSGGQKQRVAITRCLLQKKSILILDEPFSSLDPVLRKQMLNLVSEICHSHQLTLLMVTHQTDEAHYIATRSMIIANGRVEFDGPTAQLPATRDVFF